MALQTAAWLAVVASALMSVIAVLISFRALALQRASHNLNALFSVVGREYLDREFTSTTPPIIDGEEIRRTRPLKSKARDELAASSDAWSEAVLKHGTWENKLAFEVSIALERVGVAAFSGALPLRFLLPLAADQILEDWTYCAAWVDDYRQRQRTFDGTTPFHRRYAEWLVLASAVWMARHYENYRPLKEVEDRFGGRPSVQKRLLDRSSAERDTMEPSVRSEMRALTGVRL
jgi:hypothetical protein